MREPLQRPRRSSRTSMHFRFAPEGRCAGDKEKCDVSAKIICPKVRKRKTRDGKIVFPSHPRTDDHIGPQGMARSAPASIKRAVAIKRIRTVGDQPATGNVITKRIDRRQSVPGSKGDDQIAISARRRCCRHNQACVGPGRKCGERTLDLAPVARECASATRYPVCSTTSVSGRRCSLAARRPRKGEPPRSGASTWINHARRAMLSIRRYPAAAD
jgi:hypothetical protein